MHEGLAVSRSFVRLARYARIVGLAASPLVWAAAVRLPCGRGCTMLSNQLDEI